MAEYLDCLSCFYGVLGTSPLRVSGRGRSCTVGAVALLPVKLIDPTLGDVTALVIATERPTSGMTLKEYCFPVPTRISPRLQEIAVGRSWLQLGFDEATKITGLEKLTCQTAAL